VVRSALAGEVAHALTEPFGELATDVSMHGLLVLTEEEGILDELARLTTSLSCSLGPALESGMAPFFTALGRVGTAHLAGGWLRLYVSAPIAILTAGVPSNAESQLTCKLAIMYRKRLAPALRVPQCGI